MTHAARTHEIFAKADEIKEQILQQVEAMDALKKQLETAHTEADRQLAMANALALLRAISTRHMPESQRIWRTGVIKQLSNAL